MQRQTMRDRHANRMQPIVSIVAPFLVLPVLDLGSQKVTPKGPTVCIVVPFLVLPVLDLGS